ncbi:SRPBCC domain-containing protein [Actinomadura sediminis]|uniref:SRPBCC domain-containing protein n=1 Tax=Actinomadura sediminis TaxID=1038904 RepID=A0ABW3EMU9_9ACTN
MTESALRPDVGLTLDAVSGRPVLRFEQAYAHPAERVWRALTDGAELSEWTPWRVEIDPVPGGRITLAFGGGEPSRGVVTAAEEHRELAFRWPGIPGSADDEILRWTLRPAADGSVLALHVTLQDIGHAPQSAAGYHLSLEHLGALLSGGPVRRAADPPSDPRFRSLVEHYTAVLPA